MDKSIRQLAERLNALASGREQSLVSEQLALELDKVLKDFESFEKLSRSEKDELLRSLKEKELELKKVKEGILLSW